MSLHTREVSLRTREMSLRTRKVISATAKTMSAIAKTVSATRNTISGVRPEARAAWERECKLGITMVTRTERGNCKRPRRFGEAFVNPFCRTDHIFEGASTPENTSTPSGNLFPLISIARTAEFSSAISAELNFTASAPLFSII